MPVPEPVLRAARFPELDLPAPPPEHPFERIDREWYSLGGFRGMSFGMVIPHRFEEDAFA